MALETLIARLRLMLVLMLIVTMIMMLKAMMMTMVQWCMLHMGWRQLDAKCCLNSTFNCSTDFALLLHCIYTDFALLLCCVYNVFALLLLPFNFDWICTAFTLHLHCFCNFDWIALVCNFWHFWDSVALCHPLNYIRECKLFKRWTKIQIHITLTKSECTLVEECKTRKTMPCTIPWSDAFNCNEKSQWRMKYLLCADVECNKLVKLWRCEGWSLRWLNSGRHIFGVFLYLGL